MIDEVEGICEVKVDQNHPSNEWHDLPESEGWTSGISGEWKPRFLSGEACVLLSIFSIISRKVEVNLQGGG